MKLLLVGNRSGTNIAGSLERGARGMGIETRVMETRRAFDAPFVVRQLSWRLAGRRPPRMKAFGSSVVSECEAWRPDLLVALGTAPLEARTLQRLRELGVTTVNFATDDPWSRGHHAAWFLGALREYDCVATPRRANLDDLRRHGARRVEYLPFGYDPELFWHEETQSGEAIDDEMVDLLFVGGADRDRLPFLRAAIEAGLRVAIHGEYWQRFAVTRPHTRGQVGPEVLRRTSRAARVSLCLTRRSNRDGHVMRSFEIPAMGGCILAEDTPEHREIFGGDGECALFFRTPPEMVERARELIADDPRRAALATAAHRRVTGRPNTYADRLRTIVGWFGINPDSDLSSDLFHTALHRG